MKNTLKKYIIVENNHWTNEEVLPPFTSSRRRRNNAVTVHVIILFKVQGAGAARTTQKNSGDIEIIKKKDNYVKQYELFQVQPEKITN